MVEGQQHIEAWRGRLRAARERAGLSQRQAAERAGVSVSLWRNVEKGYHHVSGLGQQSYRTTPDAVARMAAAVRLDPVELVREAGWDAEDAPVQVAPVEAVAVEDEAIVVVRVPSGVSTAEVVETLRQLFTRPGQ